MKNHFRRVTELAVPVHAIYGKKYFPGSALSLVGPGDESLLLTLPGLAPSTIDTVAVSYSVDSYLHTFEARVAEARADRDRAVTPLTMGPPDRVAGIERRKSPRVPCSRQDAVGVRLHLRNGQPFRGTAIDVGCHGASFYIPRRPFVFQVGETFPVLFNFPRLGELRLHAAVRVTTDAPDGTRLGVEFLNPSEEDADLIRQYVHLRQLQIRTGQKSTAQTPRRPVGESIFVVAVADPLGARHLILCTDAFVGQIDASPGAFSEIVSVDVIEYLEKG